MLKHIPNPIIEEIENAPPPQISFEAIKDLRYSFFLDSATDPDKLGRFSFLGHNPFLVFKSKQDSITLEWSDGRHEVFRDNPFSFLKNLFKRFYLKEGRGMYLPFTAGGVGYFAYDMKAFIERLPEKAIDDLNIADCIMGFYDTVVIYDNLERRCYIASYDFSGRGVVKMRASAKARLEELKNRIGSGPIRKSCFYTQDPMQLQSNFSISSYTKAIEKAKEYIKKGDIYQVNLSQRFEARLPIEPFELYMRLRTFSPAPFSAYLNCGDVIVASSSPERFLLKKGDYIETRPIKGTRPRGGDLLSDARFEGELLESKKDRAEHIMIVDLERNDIGRICEYSTVRPREFVILEKYATVFHLVSTVSGKLRKGIDPIDCLLATFPGGSITGAPKIRAMEIIDELEPVRRSIYTGSIGYISFGGNMDASIVIRTFIIKDGKVYFQAGGGIVADSDPESEYFETVDKARGLMQALGVEAPSREKVLVKA